MSRRRYISTRCFAMVLVAFGLFSCQVDENRESSREGERYYLNGRATGMLAGFHNANCGWSPTGGGQSGFEDRLVIDLSLGANDQLDDRSPFGDVLRISLNPLPPNDRTRKAAVLETRAFADDIGPTGGTVYGFSGVVAEYEYGVPLEENVIIWLHKLRIPEQTFVHHEGGEITVSGSLDGLVMECIWPDIN